MFLGLVAALVVPTKGEENFGVVGYDCSDPSNIRVYDAGARCQQDQEIQGEPEVVKILQIVNTEKLNGFKCRVKSHKKYYYCGMFSYSKPIMSAEREETLVISTQDCRTMANTKVFVTPQARKSESIVVPGQSFIMEFELGFQTASNSAITCQGMDVLLDGSIQSGIVMHTEYEITIEEELFTKNQDHVIARSSSEKLTCNPHGPRLGCVGALHTYAWNPPKSNCMFREVRELTGVFSTWSFAAEQSQIYYELKGVQNLPNECGNHKVQITNVQDIYLLRAVDNTEVKLHPISPEELSNAAELRSLALFLRYKMEIGEGRRNELGIQMSCEANVKEPSEAPPHHLGGGVFVFKRGEIVYQYSCSQVTVKLMEKEHCYLDIPIHQEKEYRFISLANRMLITSSAQEPCVPHFAKAMKGIKNWIKISPKLRSIPPPRTDTKETVQTHHEDELGLYTQAEERDFDHVAGLAYYTTQVQQRIVHAVCKNDESCDLNPLPGSPSYSLKKLEQEAEDFITLGGWNFFLKKVWEPVWYAIRVYATIGGCITTTQSAFWVLGVVKRGVGACCKSPVAENKFSDAMLMELMGDSNQASSAPARKGGVRFYRRKGSDGEVELGIPT